VILIRLSGRDRAETKRDINLAMPNIVVDAEFKALIPELTAEELTSLEASLKAEGCRDRLVTWHGMLLDGHHRLAICQVHNIPFKTLERECDSRADAKMWIIHNQFARRNLPPFERSNLVIKLEPLFAARAKANMAAGGVIKKPISQIGFAYIGGPDLTY
jgi:hypothetical protein